MDDRHEQTRRKLRTEHRGRGSEQLVAGVKGLGFGLIGGITSIVTQTYNGAYSDGVPVSIMTYDLFLCNERVVVF